MKHVRLTRQQSKDATRERLLASAHALFLQNGIAGATIEQITADAGYTRGAFYSNFDSKEAVLLELLLRNTKEMTLEASDIASIKGDSQLMRMAILNYYQKLFYKNDAFILWAEARILAFRDEKFRADFNLLIKDALAYIVDILNKFADGAEVTLPAPAPYIAFGLAALFEGIQANKISNPQHITDDMVEAVMAHFLSSALFNRQS
jgi:AcrR family transcriptional regulator